ncbi:hypothetical protein BDK51DRAFT_39847 [Blyttiomyces helicus]|uniref:Uncharacterized protein n=1 Tax=Blyttiomyces helicus TaxID=388810 RepID=A0A4P9W4L1_9FUNG|nr:hypothetical protein BDK51DRAFT_39847 [Blyttiomyces helicus]|eukprot:RKO86842.1 hypothetical protein BDK51DRAFT_39847 [Blyttiomyces helicus]
MVISFLPSSVARRPACAPTNTIYAPTDATYAPTEAAYAPTDGGSSPAPADRLAPSGPHAPTHFRAALGPARHVTPKPIPPAIAHGARGPREVVTSIAFNRTGSKVYAAAWKGLSVRCLDVGRGDTVPILPKHALQGPLTCIGDTVVSGTRERMVVACNPEPHRPPLALPRLGSTCTVL